MACDNDYDRFNFDEKVIVIVNGHSFERIYKIIKINNIPDSKRQQTTTVDYKRLFNGLVLTRVASLQWK
jgi:translation elongation factor P/translation initiation factor 5A